MCTTKAIVGVANCSIQGVILCVASCDQDSGLVAPKKDWDKHGSMRVWVFRNDILEIDKYHALDNFNTNLRPDSKPNYLT